MKMSNKSSNKSQPINFINSNRMTNGTIITQLDKKGKSKKNSERKKTVATKAKALKSTPIVKEIENSTVTPPVESIFIIDTVIPPPINSTPIILEHAVSPDDTTKKDKKEPFINSNRMTTGTIISSLDMDLKMKKDIIHKRNVANKTHGLIGSSPFDDTFTAETLDEKWKIYNTSDDFSHWLADGRLHLLLKNNSTDANILIDGLVAQEIPNESFGVMFKLTPPSTVNKTDYNYLVGLGNLNNKNFIGMTIDKFTGDSKIISTALDSNVMSKIISINNTHLKNNERNNIILGFDYNHKTKTIRFYKYASDDPNSKILLHTICNVDDNGQLYDTPSHVGLYIPNNLARYPKYMQMHYCRKYNMLVE